MVADVVVGGVVVEVVKAEPPEEQAAAQTARPKQITNARAGFPKLARPGGMGEWYVGRASPRIVRETSTNSTRRPSPIRHVTPAHMPSNVNSYRHSSKADKFRFNV